MIGGGSYQSMPSKLDIIYYYFLEYFIMEEVVEGVKTSTIAVGAILTGKSSTR